MKKIFLFAVAVLMTASLVKAQSVMLVEDDNVNSDEFLPIATALQNGGFTFDTINLVNTDTILYSDIQNYDMIIWTTGSDRVALNLWDTTSTPGTIKFYPALQQYYDNKDGVIWIDGIDFLKPLVIQTDGSANDNDTMATLLPLTFNDGSFIHDVLGIAQWNYESKSMGDNGVPEADKASSNDITTPSVIQWQWSTLWRGDGWTPVAGAVDLYDMGDASYGGAGYSMAFKYVSNGVTMYISSLRIGKLGDGSSFQQSAVDQLVSDIVSTAPVAVKNIENTNISVYPNPVVDVVNINGVQNAQVVISDVTGKSLVSQNVNGNTSIDVSGLAEGVYNLTIITEGNVYTQKILVK